jgi:hypothetical protein
MLVTHLSMNLINPPHKVHSTEIFLSLHAILMTVLFTFFRQQFFLLLHSSFSSSSKPGSSSSSGDSKQTHRRKILNGEKRAIVSYQFALMC